MKRMQTLKRILFSPLVYLLALYLMLEDWLWDWGGRLAAALARHVPLERLERWLGRLGPRTALAALLLPLLLLLPVKVLALLAMAYGHAWLGLLVVLLAKLAGAAAVARLYVLTRPALLQLAWFAALLAWFLPRKARWIARLHASAPWRALDALRRWRRRRGPAVRLARLLRRLALLWRGHQR